MRKSDAPLPTSDMLLMIAYAAQYDSRNFNGAQNQRKKNSDAERKLSSWCSLSSEIEDVKLFRTKLLGADKLLIRNELDHRPSLSVLTLSI